MNRVRTLIESGWIFGDYGLNGDVSCYSFTGVPYARVPEIFQRPHRIVEDMCQAKWVGGLPCFRNFLPDGDPTPFRTIGHTQLYGTSYDPAAGPEPTERFLFLNVYTPQIPKGVPSKLKPIMVFIPGEHYMPQYNKTQFYTPRQLVSQGIVVVVVHYRTGILGFLTLHTPNIRIKGNAGLRDILRALNWVQRNAASFEGDRQNVTIWGQGFGAVCVNYLLVSKHALDWVYEPMQGFEYKYFHKAIMQSGSFENSWAKSGRGLIEYKRRYLVDVGENPDQIYFHLVNNTPIEELLDPRRNYLHEFLASEKPLMGPIVDNDVIRREPERLIIELRIIQPIPIIVGFNSSEGFVAKLMNWEIDNQEIRYRPHLCEDLNVLTHENYYEDFGPETIEGRYDMITDFCYVRGILQSVILLKENMPETSRVYLYKFSYDEPPLNVIKAEIRRRNNGNFPYEGACHGDELGYLFTTPLHPVFPTEIEREAIDGMINMWTNFAKYGEPLTEIPLDEFGDRVFEWYPVEDLDEIAYLDIGREYQMYCFEDRLFLNRPIYKIPRENETIDQELAPNSWDDDPFGL